MKSIYLEIAGVLEHSSKAQDKYESLLKELQLLRNIQKVKQLRESLEEALHEYELEDVMNYSSI